MGKLRQLVQSFADSAPGPPATEPSARSRSQPSRRDSSDNEPSPVRVMRRRRVRVRRQDASSRSRSPLDDGPTPRSPPDEASYMSRRRRRVRVRVDAETGARSTVVHQARPVGKSEGIFGEGTEGVEVSSEAEGDEGDEAALYSWLEGLDLGQGALLQYYEVIKRKFNSDFEKLAALRLSVPRGPGALGGIEPSFWDICGVRQTGHRLLFAKGLAALPRKGP